jgi:integrase
VDYVKVTLPKDQAAQLADEAKQGLDALKAQIPRVSTRAKLGARQGLTQEQEDLLLNVIALDSPQNPWAAGFVRVRNRLMVITLLATGMRRGELLGLQVRDISTHQAKVQILRRADTREDARVHQPNAKTCDREIPIAPTVLRALTEFIRTERHNIKAARKIPQVFTSDEGNALSLSSLNQVFVDIRRACEQLPRDLTSHVMRHTWNERFSELADAVGMSEVEEQNARALHQGWAVGSKMGATYTRRHTERKAREMALGLQHKLEGRLDAGS